MPNRVLKDSQQRIVGEGNKIKGAFKDLENKLKQVPRDALKQWKDFVN